MHSVAAALAAEIATGQIEVVDPGPWETVIEAGFPMGLNRIAWEFVELKECAPVLRENRAVTQGELCDLLRAHVADVERWFRQANVKEDDFVVWLGDSTDETLRMKSTTFLTHFAFLMSFPQHAYLVPSNGSWCLNYVMEGDLWFGYADPSSPKVGKKAQQRGRRPEGEGRW